MTAACYLSGLALLALLVLDVFLTAFHPEANGGYVHRLLLRVVWRAVRGVATHSGRRRGTVLALGGPLISVFTLLAWFALLLAGFALFYYPDVAAGRFIDAPDGSAWAVALYLSGAFASTIGAANAVAGTDLMRLLTVGQGVFGFALVTVTVSYLLSVNREVQKRVAVATELAFHLRQPAAQKGEPWTMDEQHLQRAEQWANGLTPQLAELQAAHHQYPVLHYYWSKKPDDALPLQIGRLLTWLRRLEDADDEDSLFIPPSPLLGLRRAIQDYLRDVYDQFVPESAIVSEAEEEDEWARRHKSLLRYLGHE